MSSAGEVLDEEALAELREDLGEAFPAFVAGFLQSAHGTVAELRADVSRADLAAAGARAHQLKGTAGYLGATTLVFTLAALQAACDTGEEAKASSLVEEVARVVATVAPLLEAAASGS